MIRVDYHGTTRLGGVGFPFTVTTVFTVHRVGGDGTADDWGGIRGGLGGNRRRGGRDTGINVQHEAVRFRVVTGFVGHAHDVRVVAIAQAVIPKDQLALPFMVT